MLKIFSTFWNRSSQTWLHIRITWRPLKTLNTLATPQTRDPQSLGWNRSIRIATYRHSWISVLGSEWYGRLETYVWHLSHISTMPLKHIDPPKMHLQQAHGPSALVSVPRKITWVIQGNPKEEPHLRQSLRMCFLLVRWHININHPFPVPISQCGNGNSQCQSFSIKCNSAGRCLHYPLPGLTRLSHAWTDLGLFWVATFQFCRNYKTDLNKEIDGVARQQRLQNIYMRGA